MVQPPPQLRPSKRQRSSAAPPPSATTTSRRPDARGRGVSTLMLPWRPPEAATQGSQLLSLESQPSCTRGGEGSAAPTNRGEAAVIRRFLPGPLTAGTFPLATRGPQTVSIKPLLRVARAQQPPRKAPCAAFLARQAVAVAVEGFRLIGRGEGNERRRCETAGAAGCLATRGSRRPGRFLGRGGVCGAVAVEGGGKPRQSPPSVPNRATDSSTRTGRAKSRLVVPVPSPTITGCS